MLKILLQQGSVNEKSCGVERTALMMACAAGKVDVVKILLENGAALEITDRCLCEIMIFLNLVFPLGSC